VDLEGAKMPLDTREATMYLKEHSTMPVDLAHWTLTDTDEEEESKWQSRAHMGEIEEEVKTLRDTVVIFGVVNTVVLAAIMGIIIYAAI
jgi:hypothetical protein